MTIATLFFSIILFGLLSPATSYVAGFWIDDDTGDVLIVGSTGGDEDHIQRNRN